MGSVSKVALPPSNHANSQNIEYDFVQDSSSSNRLTQVQNASGTTVLSYNGQVGNIESKVTVTNPGAFGDWTVVGELAGEGIYQPSTGSITDAEQNADAMASLRESRADFEDGNDVHWFYQMDDFGLVLTNVKPGTASTSK